MKTITLLTNLITSVVLMFPMLTFSQNLMWAKNIGGSTTSRGIITDASGNVITVGYFNGAPDFDPGPGTFTLPINGLDDIFITKLDPAGNFVWAKAIGGTGSDQAQSVDTDASGNVYITGFFQVTVDFDPNGGVSNLVSSGGEDVFVCKLDPAGNFVWAKDLGGTSTEQAYGIKVDASGNILTTGLFSGTPDFDPGAGVFNLTPPGLAVDLFICKLNAAGNFVWAKALSGNFHKEAYSITTDASGNVYTTGIFQSTADFDPGAGTFNLTSNGSIDFYISKLDAAGNFVWAKAIGGTAIEYGRSITTDGLGNVLTCGFFNGTVDFDPGAGTFNMASVNGSDAFVVKLDAAGNFVWAKDAGGVTANSIFADGSNDIFIGGSLLGTEDVDPGVGVFTLSSVGLTAPDVLISKLDASGNFIWAGLMGGPNADGSNAITVSSAGNIFSTGGFQATGDFDPGIGVFNLAYSGGTDAYVLKMCPSSFIAGTLTGSTTVCYGSSNVYSISPGAGVNSYTWNLPGGWTGTSSTNSIAATPVSSGIFTLTLSNLCGVGPPQTLSVTIKPLPTITVNNGTVCLGNSFTIIPSGASTYTISGGSATVTPAFSSSYFISGTSSFGCISAAQATSDVLVNSLPTVNALTSFTSICIGSSATLTASGANTYTWYPGGTGITKTVFPVSLTVYSLTGKDLNGCTNSATVQIDVKSLPMLTITASSTVICFGETATLTVIGATDYTWTTGQNNDTIVISPPTSSVYPVDGATNGCFNSSSFFLTVNPCTGIHQQSSDNLNFIVYPNPGNGVFFLKMDNFQNTYLTIYNLTGQKISDNSVHTELIKFDISSQPSGIYFIEMNQNGVVTRNKLIKH